MENHSHGTPDPAGDRTVLKTQALLQFGNALGQEDIWLMEERALRVMLRDPAGFLFSAQVLPRDMSARAPETAPRSRAGSVALLSLVGPILYRGSWWADFLGLPTIQGFQARFRQALNDDSIKSIVIDVDSPGGEVPGVQELAAEILAARERKQIVAVANPQAASAAYWIASAAGELVVTPSGEVGSVGVWAGHVDLSKALDMEGVKITLISAGEFKTEGNPWEPLTEEARVALQERVDEVHTQFVRDLAKARNVTTSEVKANFGKGRMMSAKKALAAGMVDRIATLDQVLGRLGVPAQARQGAAAALEPEPEALAPIAPEPETQLDPAVLEAARTRELEILEVS